MATELHGLPSDSFTSQPKGRLWAPEYAQAHIGLAKALQTALDTEKLVLIFFRYLEHFVAVTGLEYQPAEGTSQHLGTPGRNQCDYRLSCEGTALGKLLFSRDRRFTETELQLLEELLGTLVFPLRNAASYQSALQLALLDPLTGLSNRIALDKALDRELQLARRHQRALSLLVIDVDHFKRINDTHGHSYGDDVLRQVAQMIQNACRATDLCFRYGGEEFVVLLSNTPCTGAKIIAERIRAEVNALPQGISVSIGISTCAAQPQRAEEHPGEPAEETLFERA